MQTLMVSLFCFYMVQMALMMSVVSVGVQGDNALLSLAKKITF